MIEPDDPPTYPVISVGLTAALAPAIGGAIGGGLAGLSGSGDSDQSNAFTAAVAAQHLALGSELAADIDAALQRDGYEVVRLAHRHNRPNAFLDGYADVNSAGDAVLDVVLADLNYKETLVLPFRPTLRVSVQLIDAKTGRNLFSESYNYAPNPAIGWVSLAVDKKYYFRNFDELMNNAPQAADGLRSGAQLIAERLGEALKRRP